MHNARKMIAALLAAAVTAGCTATADERIGEAQGYGGTLRVNVTLDGGKITAVQVLEHKETQNVGTRAIDTLPDAIVKAGSPDVDTVTGATVTSKAIIAAVKDALGTDGASASPAGSPAASPSVSPMGQQAADGMPADALSGIGISAMGRIGPGEDDQGNPIYSFNVVMAHGMFDAKGRVLSLDVDQLEVTTPNIASASSPRFSGFPGQGGFAAWDEASGKVGSAKEATEETFMEEIAAWKTKRARGDDYRLTTATWAEEMDAYEQAFTGKTVDEIEEWFGKYCSDANGRPLTESSDKEGDKEKYDALTDSEKQMLADITSKATISLKDVHGDIIAAIRAAWEDAQRK